MTVPYRIEPKWNYELLKKWAKERQDGIQYVTPHKTVKAESTEWRSYFSSWQEKYWDLMYKRGSYVNDLRELNMWQAAKIMQLEHDLRVAKRELGLAANRYLKDT